jgi:ABC-type sugar transport system ATPase subunit
VTEQLLEVKNLSKNFDRLPVLKHVSFPLARGEVLGLVGRQGAGKSTLLHLISGTMTPSSGTIFIDGKPRRFANRIETQKLGIETVYQTTGPMNRFDAVNNAQWDRELGAATATHTSGLVESADATYNILLGREVTRNSFLRIIDWKKMIDIARDCCPNLTCPRSWHRSRSVIFRMNSVRY